MKQSQMTRALFWKSVVSEPLFTLYGLAAVILYRDLGATVFQIALLACCKPVITILSFYWSAGLSRGGRLKSNILWAEFFMRAPFLLCPWIHSVWFVIGAIVNYTFFLKAVTPGWMEMIKRTMDPSERGKAFSWSSALGYAEGLILSLAMAAILDRNPDTWRFLFFSSAAVGLVTLIVQARVPMEENVHTSEEKIPIKEVILRPWKDSYRLLKERPDFSRFQWGFMACGFGIMLIQPILPVFAVEKLGVSHVVIAGGISIAKGLGFVLFSPLWSRWMEKFSIFTLASLVFLSSALFPLFMAFSLWNISFFYAAYFCLGIGMGGNHLVWNMAGPIFADKEESSRYTSVGLVLTGLRGAIAPLLGNWLAATWLSPIQVLLIGAIFCFYGGIHLLKTPSFSPKPINE